MAESWLERKFTEFFIEVQRHVVAVRTGRWQLAPESPRPKDLDDYRGKGPDAAWESIAMLLRRHEAEARETQAVPPQVYKEAQYAMVCLAHDLFVVHLGEWPGRQGWLNMPLEKAFFNSSIGGGEVFRRIDKLLERRDPADRDLAKVYFDILSLGFLGKYGGKRQPAGRTPREIEDVRRRLFNAFDGFGKGAGEISGEISRQPYQTVKRGESTGPARIPAAGQSLLFLGVAVAVIAVALWGTIAWLRSDIDSSLERIVDRNEHAAASR